MGVEHQLGEKSLVIILLRFEYLEKWESVVQRYIPDFRMRKSNSHDSKWYANIYKEFVATYPYDEHELEVLCNDDTMQFYSEKEIHAMAPQCAPEAKERAALKI